MVALHFAGLALHLFRFVLCSFRLVLCSFRLVLRSPNSEWPKILMSQKLFVETDLMPQINPPSDFVPRYKIVSWNIVVRRVNVSIIKDANNIAKLPSLSLRFYMQLEGFACLHCLKHRKRTEWWRFWYPILAPPQNVHQRPRPPSPPPICTPPLFSFVWSWMWGYSFL